MSNPPKPVVVARTAAQRAGALRNRGETPALRQQAAPKSGAINAATADQNIEKLLREMAAMRQQLAGLTRDEKAIAALRGEVEKLRAEVSTLHEAGDGGADTAAILDAVAAIRAEVQATAKKLNDALGENTAPPSATMPPPPAPKK